MGERRRKRKKETDRVREEEQTVRQREWVREEGRERKRQTE